MSTAAERVRAYLQARTAYYQEIKVPLPGEVAGIHDWDTGKDVFLTEEDLASLLPEPGAALRSPALEVHDTWYSARTPDNQLYIETRDPEEFTERCSLCSVSLTLRKHTVYKYGTAEILKELP